MTRKSEFRRLFREAFRTEPDWADWFFEKVYRDDEALLLDAGSGPVSALLLSPRDMAFHSSVLPVAYISCVATARAERGKGHMQALMRDALVEAAARGRAMAVLIPASPHLYFFYDKFGFATVFYTDEQRYTSLHTFEAAPEFEPVEPTYDIFRHLENLRPGAVLHDREQYGHVLTDIAFDGGSVLAVSDPDGHSAIAFVTADSGGATVLDLLADTPRSAEAVLGCVRDTVGDVPLVVRTVPAGRQAALHARGMARITDAEAVLRSIAAADTRVHQTIRVRDGIIPANDATFILDRGTCTRADAASHPRPDLDVTVDVLARIIFSAPATGDIFNLPTARPYISLMLD